MDKPMWITLAVLAVGAALAYAAYFAFVVVGAFKRKPGGAPDNQEPACGRCGYLVRGIPSFTCPECGSDLRDVGIEVGKRRGGAGWLAVIVLVMVWSLCMWLAGGLIDMLVMEWTPRYSSNTSRSTLGFPKSRAYENVTIKNSLRFPELTGS